MKRYFRVFFGMLLSATMIISCERDDTESYDLSEQTSVSLSINVDDMESGTATRSSIKVDDNDGISSDVKSLWIAQCNGTADTSQVLMAHYVADVSVTDALDLTFIQSERSHTMVYLANVDQTIIDGETTKDLITVGMTLAQIKALAPTLSAPTSATQLYTTGLVNTISKTAYFTMSGEEVVTAMNSSTKLKASLKRNAVKVTINLLNKWHDSTIKGVTLMSAADTTAYHLNYSSFSTTSNYPSTLNSTIDHPEYELSIDGDIFAGEDDNDTVSVNFYIPANMRGTNSSSTSEATKPTYAPDGATYIVIRVEDDESEFFYTYYLGANLIDDYNLIPNYHYTYDITFTGVGNVGSDPRIEGTVEVDYSLLSSSNCYIINSSDSYDKIYYLPIAERINDFWTNYDSTNTYDSAPLVETASLADWSCEVAWYDNDTDPIAESSDAINNKIYIEESINNDLRCLKITISKGFNNWGNILVAVKDTNSFILWSWHLWVTDYNPDSYTTYQSKSISTVTGGEIHHYDDAEGTTIWGNDGVYEDKYIMDRNLGARDATTDYGSGEGTLYYQWGSKNPIPGTAGKFTSDYGGTTTTPLIIATTTGETFASATRNPTTFYKISAANWCSEIDSYDCFWNDENSEYDSSSPNYSKKSIFDPSPLGWKVPISGTWSGFTTNYEWSDNYLGYAFYPALGSRLNSSGALTVVGERYYSWSATPDNISNSYHLSINVLNEVVRETSNPCAYGFCVRPIQE